MNGILFKKIFSKNFLFLFLSQLLILWASYINIMPKGHFFSSGDVVQIYNFPKIIHNLLFTWYSSGEGYFLLCFGYIIYYAFFFLITFLSKIDLSQQSFIYYYSFLFFSFWSFYFSLNFYPLFKKRTEFWHRIALSLVYAFNIQTFHNFYTGWGYTPVVSLYPLIPLIFAVSYKYFEEEKFNLKLLALLGTLFFLSGMPAGNFAFFAILNILLFIFILCFFFLSRRKGIIYYIKKSFLFYSVLFLSCFWAVIPQLVPLLDIRTKFNNNYYIFDLGSWILWQASKFPNPLFAVYDIDWYIQGLSPLVLLSISLFSVVMIGIMVQKRKTAVASSYLFLLIFNIFILNKGKGILDSRITLLLFNNIVFSSIRGADKSLIFLPFFLLISFFLCFKNDRKHGVLVLILLSTSFLSVFPFLTGGIQTKYRMSADSSHLTLHVMPKEYSDSAKQFNLNKLDDKIFAGPYSVINSFGWVNYPKWGVIGADPTFQLYDKPIIHMNSFSNSFGVWNYGKDWNSQTSERSKWILPFSGMLNANYWLYHKDVDPKFLEETVAKVNFYEKEDFIEKIDDNDYFTLYKINSKFFLPHFYIPLRTIYSPNNVEILPNIVSLKDYSIRTGIYFADSAVKTDEVIMEVKLENSLIEWIDIKNIGNMGATYPSIKYKPGTLNWKLALLKEKYDEWKVRNETENLIGIKLFYGNKRINEFINFYSDIEGSGLVTKIAEFYRAEMRGAIELLGKIGDEKKKTELIIKIRNNIADNKDKIRSDETKKRKLMMLAEFGMGELEKSLEEYIPKFNIEKKEYKIKIPKDGEYSLLLWNNADNTDDFTEGTNGSLEIDGKKLEIEDQQLEIREDGWIDFVKANFKEGEYKAILTFDIVPNLVTENNWQEEVTETETTVCQQIGGWENNRWYQISGEVKGDFFFGKQAQLTIGEEKRQIVKEDLPKKKSFVFYFRSGSDVKGKRMCLDYINPKDITNLAIRPVWEPKITLRSNTDNLDKEQIFPKITFFKTNSTKYRIKVEGAKERYMLVFSESFHPGWKIWVANTDKNGGVTPMKIAGKIGEKITSLFLKNKRYGEIVASYFDGDIKEGTHRETFLEPATFETWGKKSLPEERHSLVNGYANSWEVLPEDVNGKENYELIVEFEPQRLYYIGIIISFITLGACLIKLTISVIGKKDRIIDEQF